jgi:hypothetical protein
VPETGHPTTGTPLVGVPVVDLTATVQDLLEHAEACREAQRALMLAAAQTHRVLSRQADYLEDLARILSGEHR